jgi:hypothetical protein
MRSFTTRQFREAYRGLPETVRERARRAYQLFLRDPSHPSLNFKKIDEQNNLYSARVSLGYRALAKRDGGDVVWYWIGPHGNYDRKV